MQVFLRAPCALPQRSSLRTYRLVFKCGTRELRSVRVGKNKLDSSKHGVSVRNSLKNQGGSSGGDRTEKKSLDDWIFQTVLLASLSCVLLIGKNCAQNFQDVIQNADEAVWLNERGPFSSHHHRAFAVVPLAMCITSSVVAAVVATRFPARISTVKLDSNIHQLVALPMTMLLCFRFDNSYNRWWTGRQEVENVSLHVIQLAAMSASNMDLTVSSPSARQSEEVADRIQLLSLLDALCNVAARDIAEEGTEPHPDNKVENWAPATAKLSEKDATDFLACENDVLWCVDRIVGCIHKGQASGTFSGELASEMYEKVNEIVKSLHVCKMIETQVSPAPFIVHMRTLLLMFCFTFPYTIIGTVRPITVVAINGCVSFGLLGIEFCSREMEHPFGDDMSDVPVQLILNRARTSIERFRKMHSKNSM